MTGNPELCQFIPCPGDGMTHEGDEDCGLLRGRLVPVSVDDLIGMVATVFANDPAPAHQIMLFTERVHAALGLEADRRCSICGRINPGCYEIDDGDAMCEEERQRNESV